MSTQYPQPADPANWDDDAETEYLQRPNTGFGASPALRLGDDDRSARFDHPASGEWLRPSVHMPASDFGSAFGYRGERRSRAWLWIAILCLAALGAVELARGPYGQPALDRLSAVAERLGIREPLERVARAIVSRIPSNVHNAPAAGAAPAPAVPEPSSAAAGPSAPLGPSAAPPHGAAMDAKPRSHVGKVRWIDTPAGQAWHERHLQALARKAHALAVADSAPLTPSALESDSVDVPSPASSDATGVLAINSLPWAEISVDGNWMGTTPQRAIKLREGRHKIKLVNPDMNIVRIFTVQIESGQTLTKSVLLSP